MAKKTIVKKRKPKPSPKTSKRRHVRASRTPTSAARSVTALIRQTLEASSGIIRMAPTWVPRAFLTPGRRLKLALQDLYALGSHRGGIDERWLSSTTAASNPDAPPDEGLSYIAERSERVCTLREAIALEGERLIGPPLWERYRRWPVFAKLFDNSGAIPLHMHANNSQAALIGQQGKPEGYYFPPQLNGSMNAFPYTFFGLEPGTTAADIRRCLERWSEGDNGILDFSRAYQLRPGTGWLVPPCILHAPGSLVTFEPQWGSDVYAFYQSISDGRPLPWEMLVRDVPEDRKRDIDYLVSQLDWNANVDPQFKQHHYLEPMPVADTRSEGYLDRWIVYGKIDGQEMFTAKELTVNPGVRVTIKDNGAYGLIAVQGSGWIGKQRLQTPVMIRYGELTEDEVFVTYEAARQGVIFDNTGGEPLVILRYFGPDTNPQAPALGNPGRN
jgi:hypothetical protein